MRLPADGFVCPSWEDLATGEVTASPEEDEEDPNQPRVGWQSKAACKVEARSFAHLLGTLRICRKHCCGHKVDLTLQLRSTARQPTGCRALIPSLSGCSSCALTPTVRMWLGHHRSACPVAGMVGRRGFPLENVAARICREAGGRVRIRSRPRFACVPGRAARN